VYAYVRSVGAFVGATVEGSVLSFDVASNLDLYGISDPLKMEARSIPAPAQRFSCVVARLTGASAKVCG
jgi:lipid-binding SYLF domain-containing protein